MVIAVDQTPPEVADAGPNPGPRPITALFSKQRIHEFRKIAEYAYLIDELESTDEHPLTHNRLLRAIRDEEIRLGLRPAPTSTSTDESTRCRDAAISLGQAIDLIEGHVPDDVLRDVERRVVVAVGVLADLAGGVA